MNECLFHFTTPWVDRSTRSSLPQEDKAISLIISVAVGAIGLIGFLQSWYLGLSLSLSGTLLTFYGFTAYAKKSLPPQIYTPLLDQSDFSRENSLGRRVDLYGEFTPNSLLAYPQRELNSILLNSKADHFTFHERGKSQGHKSGRYAVNNALGEFLAQTEYLETPAFIQAFLKTKEIPTKSACIADLAGFEENKEQALLNYVGNAEWIIIDNSSTTIKRMPSREGHLLTVAPGHKLAARKDEEGAWWLIDSNYTYQINVPLACLHKDFSIIVPL